MIPNVVKAYFVSYNLISKLQYNIWLFKIYYFFVLKHNMKKFLAKSLLSLAALVALQANNLQAQNIQPTDYHYTVDLNAVENDILTVTLKTPQFDKSKVTFALPKMVPGTYAVYDFSRFVIDLKAFDAKGKELTAKRSKDGLSWEISKAKKLDKIVYTVEDTWDTKQSNIIFEPAGTNFDAENQVFVFNNHGVFGYFLEHDRQPLHIEVKRPETLFGGTSLIRTGGDNTTDIFYAKTYHELVDAPIMFAKPDTVNIKVGNTNVLIQTYSPTGAVTSKALQTHIEPILQAQFAYLGDSLPVDRYAFLLFLNQQNQEYLSGSAGALEHSYSSFYALFEGETDAIGKMVRDVAAHEFFHIITPLFIHSEEIHYFDFFNPKMSEHLWMYEGLTEYSAHHVQATQKLTTLEQFLQTMSQKLRVSKSFNDDVPFTEISKFCLDKYKSQYYNVYLKGALISMGLDLTLRINSNGKYGVQNLMQDLAKRYGIEKPFKDLELFDEILAVSGQSEAKSFLLAHVAGTQPIPYKDLLQAVGIEYLEEGTVEELSLFGLKDLQRGLSFNSQLGKLEIKSDNVIDAFGQKLGFKAKDILHMWNGQELTMQALNNVLGNYEQTAKEGDELTVVVKRPQEDGTYQDITLKTTLSKVKIMQKHIFKAMENPTPEQLKMRAAWLNQPE